MRLTPMRSTRESGSIGRGTRPLVRPRAGWAAVILAALLSPALGAQGTATQPVPASMDHRFAVADWARSLWDAALQRDHDRFERTLNVLADAGPSDERVRPIRAAVERLRQNEAKQERDRAARRAELVEELDEELAEAPSDLSISRALRSAIEIQLLAEDRAAAVREERIQSLIARADAAARGAEGRGDWMMASELFFRLHALLEERGIYKPDVDRLSHRLAMLRLFAPDRLWELRSQRQVADGEEPLPAYNRAGNDFLEKLRGVDESIVRRALFRAREHVEQIPMNTMLVGGVEAVKTMATTSDLRQAFPGVARAEAVESFVRFLDAQMADLAAAKAQRDSAQVDALLIAIREANDRTVQIPRAAWLHEFGNGAMDQLDDFSAIVWPDELRRFDRTTLGRVTGIGVQIEQHEYRPRIVQVIDRSPAMRMGLKAEDVITKVGGEDTLGMTLDQAVDLITGAPNTGVTIEVQREDGAGEKSTFDVTLTRAVIDITTVKGWRRTGPGEGDWDWFVDPSAGVGYLRVTQFIESTTAEFDAAIGAMRRQGLNGLVLDLRYNPGGMLDQAVEISRRFIPAGGAPVVKIGTSQLVDDVHYSKPAAASLAKMPVVVLINENSASASEIVSGALQHYAHKGLIQCVVVGDRSFGKGSVQNVFPIASNARMKLTVQYYMLPDDAIIHRKPGADAWGVNPDVRVALIPQQIEDWLAIRRNADLFGAPGERPRKAAKPPEDDANKKSKRRVRTSTIPDGPGSPDDLLTRGVDPQLETAIILLQAQAAAGPTATASRDAPAPANVP